MFEFQEKLTVIHINALNLTKLIARQLLLNFNCVIQRIQRIYCRYLLMLNK